MSDIKSVSINDIKSVINDDNLVKKIYTDVDKDNSLFIEEKEFGALKETLKDLDANAYVQVMGLFTSQSTTNNNTNNINSNTTQPMVTSNSSDSKADRKDIENAVKNYAKEKVYNYDSLVDYLKASYTNEKYSALISQVEQAVTIIGNIQKESDAKNALKAAGLWNDLTRHICHNLVKINKNNTEKENAQKAVDIYNETKAEHPEMTDYSSLEKIVLDKAKAQGLKGSAVKKAVKSAVKNDNQQIFENKLFESTTATDKKDLRSDLNGQGVNKKILRDNKDMVAVQAAYNRVTQNEEKFKNITKEEIIEIFGKNLYRKLDRNYLPAHKKEDGTYDISDLTEEILYRVGADYTLSQETDDTEMAELTHALEDADSKFNILKGDLSNKDMKKLVKGYGFDVEKNDRSAAAILEGAGLGLVSGLITGYGTGVTAHITQKVNITSSLLAELCQATGKNLTNPIDLKVLQEVIINTKLVDSIISGVIGAITGAIVVAIFGKGQNEKSCISISDFDPDNKKYTDIEQYKGYIKEKYKDQPQKAEGIIALADMMHKWYGDNWSVKFDSLLKKWAGVGSKLNCLELYEGLAHILKKDKPEPVIEEEKEEEEEEEHHDDNVDECTLNVAEEYEDRLCHYEHKIAKGDSWAMLIHTYYQNTLNQYGWTATLNALRQELGAKATDKDLPWLTRSVNGKREIYLDLPCELLGISYNVGDVAANRQKYNAKSFENGTRSQGRKIEAKRTLIGWKAWDSCDPDHYEIAPTQAEAAQKIKDRHPNRTYTNESSVIK